MKDKIGFMQGRLSDMVDGKIQAFPWSVWKKEFKNASLLEIYLMEWTLDHARLYENPLMTHSGQKEIKDLSNKYKIKIPSLTGDCFMQYPFWKEEKQIKQNQLIKDFFSICKACNNIGIQIIVIPLVDEGRLETKAHERILNQFLLEQEFFLKKLNLSILFESDFKPLKLGRFIDDYPSECFGINYDIGNSAALGYDPIMEFNTYGARIKNVHIKDRLLGGTTVPLKTGNVDFEKIFYLLNEIGYKGNYIMQTARDKNNNHEGALKHYKKMIQEWISKSKSHAT